MFYFNQTLQKLFIAREFETKFGMEIRFEELVTTEDWWSFMEYRFLDDLHGQQTSSIRVENTNISQATNQSETNRSKRLVLRDNLLLGPPRLRQIRVKEHSCHVNEAFVRYFNSCYSEYSREVEDRRPVYKG